MASLKPCPTCGKDVATDALKCPHCGSELTGERNKIILWLFVGFPMMVLLMKMMMG